jgi:hypothetical protein
MDPELRSLFHDYRGCQDDIDAVEIVRAIAATADPSAIPFLTRQLHHTGALAEALVEALLHFGRDAIRSLDRVVEHGLDWDARRHALLILARLGRVDAMRALAKDFRRAQQGPLATARWLIGCGRPGILALAKSSRVDLFEVQELAACRSQTEHLLLDLVAERHAPMPTLALAALARMPSERAIPAFERVLRSRARGKEARRIAIRGLESLCCREAAPVFHRIATDVREPLILRGACVDALLTLAAAAAA